MPKGKHRKRSENNTRNSSILPKMEVLAISDEDSANDNASVISSISGSTIYEDTHFPDEIDQNQQVELFEDKLSEAIEGMYEKSVQSRINSIESVSAALTKHFIPDFVSRRRITIADAIERSLKKGRGSEQAAAAQLAALLCLQLGSTNVVDEICQNLIPYLLVIIGDASMSCVVRAKCCWALSILTFVGNYEDMNGVMDVLRQTYSTSFKHTSLGAASSADETALYTAALSAWCLLLTVITTAPDNLSMDMKHIVTLLDSNSVEIRMAAGEIIAVILEQLKDYDGADEWEPDDEVLHKLRELATDSHKFRAKKDRKTQRSVFRDIVRYIEEGEFPKLQVRFGQECLLLDTWCRKKQYDCIRQALGSGMNLHLKENDLLRDILNLGEKVTSFLSPTHKQTKLERHLVNAAAFKARSICRGKHRDKRTLSVS